jgi:cell division protein FtsI (penicillin-binding protein 3)
MEGVVRRGSGKGLNVSAFPVAGKTGTAKISKNGKYEKTYQASFVGYFPADKPLYTCIVIINSPSNGIYYGGLVAGPVFKEVAEKVYSGSLDFIEPINQKQNILTKAPEVIKTKASELELVCKTFSIPAKTVSEETKYVSRTYVDSSRVIMVPYNVEGILKKGVVPNLQGLSAKDALYLLENNGFNVKLFGVGTVKQQSLEAGKKFNKGDKISLILS